MKKRLAVLKGGQSHLQINQSGNVSWRLCFNKKYPLKCAVIQVLPKIKLHNFFGKICAFRGYKPEYYDDEKYRYKNLCKYTMLAAALPETKIEDEAKRVNSVSYAV